MSHSSLPHTSGIPHPWLDPQENPAPALLRLLQSQPTNMQESSAFDLNEAQLAEAIGFQARRCHQCVSDGIAALQSAPADARLAGLIVHLQSEADATRQIVAHYDQMARDFFANPAPPAPARRFMRNQMRVGELLAYYDKHYYFPLGKLMQLLPGDITNVPRITPEQGQMCEAVSRYAEQAATLLAAGVKAIAQLRTIASQYLREEALPDTAALVAYLQAEAEFMHDNGSDYGDSAHNVARIV